MKKEKIIHQRILQLSFGGCLIILVVLIEFVAIHPPGIYSYTQEGYKKFKIGLSKEKVLQKINKQKTIRAIKVCGPDEILELTSRRKFELEDSLIISDHWMCHDRTGKDFVFLFKGGILERVLVQRVRFWKKNGSVLFVQCQPDLLDNIHTRLAADDGLTVFYDTD